MIDQTTAPYAALLLRVTISGYFIAALYGKFFLRGISALLGDGALALKMPSLPWDVDINIGRRPSLALRAAYSRLKNDWT
ncbi:hypothetical protein [Bradyrhizobium sp. USDA 4454]